VNLGEGYYNSRMRLSPDNEYLGFTGTYPESVSRGQIFGSFQVRIKLLHLASGTITTLVDTPIGNEYTVLGWIPTMDLDRIKLGAVAVISHPRLGITAPHARP
ncbi:MAG: hypothetical protein WBF31_19250, partial [Anaerolineae bacterium]